MEDIPALARWLSDYDVIKLKITVSKLVFISWQKHAEVILLTQESSVSLFRVFNTTLHYNITTYYYYY